MNLVNSFSFSVRLCIMVALLILLVAGSSLPTAAQQATEFRYTKKGIQIGYNQRLGDTNVTFTRPLEANMTGKLPQRLNDAWARYLKKNSAPSSYGKMKVETKGYGTEIETTSFVLPCRAEEITPGLNTYVLWVINPTGAIENKAEVLFSDTLGGSVQDSSKANSLTTQPIFAMMLTAEPHFAVVKPSRYVVLVSEPQSNSGNTGRQLGDTIVFNPSAAPFEVDPTIKQNIGEVFNVLDSKVSDDIRQVRNTLNQAQYSIAMAETVIKNIDDITALNLKPTSVESEKLLGQRGQASYTSFKDTVLARLRETLPAEFGYADNALKEAKKFYEQAGSGLNRVSSSTTRREDVLPSSLLARSAVQSGSAALVFANYAFAKVELARTRAQLSLFIKLSDQLSEEVNYLTNLREDLDGKLVLRDELIKKLKQNQSELNGHIDKLDRYVDTVEISYNDSVTNIRRFQEIDARLRKQLKDICDVLNNLISNIGESVPTANGVVIRLKSDILFRTGEYLLDECGVQGGPKSDTEASYDFVVSDAELRRQIADANRRGDTATAASLEVNRRELATSQRRDVRPILAQLSTLLRILYPTATFKFIGYTDTLDKPDYNQWLSEQRALEVARIFFSQNLELMNGSEPEYQPYLDIVKTANLLLYKRKNNNDKNGYSQFWPGGSNRPGGNLKTDARQLAERSEKLVRINQYIEGKGETALIVDTPDETSEPRNRRVEIEIKTTDQNFCNTVPPTIELKNIARFTDQRPNLEAVVEIPATEEISIPLAAIDSQTQQIVSDLKKEQLRIYDCPEPCNGQGQEMTDFSLRKTNQPLRVAIMIDESAKQQLTLGEKTAAANTFINQLTGKTSSEDKAAIFSFSRSTTYRQTLTSNQRDLTTALNAIRPNTLINGSTPNIFVSADEGGSALFDAIIEGSLALTAGEPYRKPISQKAIIVMTDGRDKASINRLEEAVRNAIAASVRVYAIGIPGRVVVDGQEETTKVNENVLQELCARTGGRFFRDSANLGNTFNLIEQDLRTGYILTYTLSDNRTREVYHRITVTGPSGYRFFYREGYFDR